jgi:hypothetical protein
MPARRTRFSEPVQAAMRRGWVAGLGAKRIAEYVKQETGETVSPRTVARRGREWREQMGQRELGRQRMRELAVAAKNSGEKASAFIRALAMEVLEDNPNALRSADPVKLGGLALSSDGMCLKHRAMDLKERQVAVSEGRFKLLEERERRAIAAIDGERDVELTPEERLRRVREIYGLGAASASGRPVREGAMEGAAES